MLCKHDHVVISTVCRLPQTWCLISLMLTGISYWYINTAHLDAGMTPVNAKESLTPMVIEMHWDWLLDL